VNVRLQVLGYALRAVAEEMGAALVRSAFSANIKERRDCSTAIFDAAGRMVAQAEHIPVHLGAMPASVAAVLACDPGPDDVFVLNDPYAGGTHLPDVTLVSRTELGWAATRAHHADVGGDVPGSMPAGSRTLAEEGVVIPPTRLDQAVLERLVAQMRNPGERRGDLRAQIATDEQVAADLRQRAATLENSVDTAALTEVAAAARAANAIIDRRTFSWTTFFNRLEETLPPGVMIASVAPQVENGRVVVTMVVIARRAEDVDDFMVKLEGAGAFRDIEPISDTVTDEGLHRVSLRGRYE